MSIRTCQNPNCGLGFNPKYGNRKFCSEKCLESASGLKARIRNKDLVITVKSNNPCVDCGENDPCCLDFHHVNKVDKSFTIGSATNCSQEKLLVEISKCIVLCANCHRKRHSKEKPQVSQIYEENGEQVKKWWKGLSRKDKEAFANLGMERRDRNILTNLGL